MKYLRTPNDGETVSVYWNLHKKCFSVRDVRGHVIMHADKVLLENAAFVVGEAGRQRVLLEGRKNVHAFVRGWFVRSWSTLPKDRFVVRRGRVVTRMAVGVSYNPYRGPHFTTADNGAIQRAPLAMLFKDLRHGLIVVPAH